MPNTKQKVNGKEGEAIHSQSPAPSVTRFLQRVQAFKCLSLLGHVSTQASQNPWSRASDLGLCLYYDLTMVKLCLCGLLPPVGHLSHQFHYPTEIKAETLRS